MSLHPRGRWHGIAVTEGAFVGVIHESPARCLALLDARFFLRGEQ